MIATILVVALSKAAAAVATAFFFGIAVGYAAHYDPYESALT